MHKGIVSVKFVAPTVNIQSGMEFIVAVKNRLTVKELMEALIAEYGEEYRRSFFEKDGREYVHFLYEGKMLEMDAYVDPGSEIWVLPPIEGG